MIKRICVMLALLCAILSVPSCGPEANDVKNSFEKHIADDNLVVILDSNSFYFPDHTIYLSKIVPNESPNEGYVFWNGKIYFSTAKQNGMFDYSFRVYECDTDGNHLNLIFEKDGYRTHPRAVGEGSTIYIEYYESNTFDSSGKIIDSYNIINNVYENVSSGKDSSLSDYQVSTSDEYSIKIQDDVFLITDSQTNASIIVGSEMLNNSNFADALKKYNYNPVHCDIINEHIYMIYRIESDSSAQYPHLVCEYVPETNEVLYKSLVLLEDVEYIRLGYVSAP